MSLGVESRWTTGASNHPECRLGLVHPGPESPTQPNVGYYSVMLGTGQSAQVASSGSFEGIASYLIMGVLLIGVVGVGYVLLPKVMEGKSLPRVLMVFASVVSLGTAVICLIVAVLTGGGPEILYGYILIAVGALFGLGAWIYGGENPKA